MPLTWVTAPDEPALTQLETGVRDRSGAALIGPAGVGKTWLLRRAAERLGPNVPRVDWIRATATRTAIPFAAVEHLVDISDTGKTAAVLRAARDRLGDGRLLVVDDAHLLEPLSAALIYQLAVGATVRLLLSASVSANPVPAEVSALWRDGLVSRIDLDPPGHDDDRLMAHVADFVDAATPQVRRVLEYLAVCDPLGLEDLAVLTSAGAVDEAVSAGAISVDDDGVHPAHPLFCDAVRAALGGPEIRRLRTAVVGRLSTAGPRGVVARLRLAALAVGSDEPPPVAQVCAAASDALRLGDLELSERLGQAALAQTPDLGARLTVGYALAWQGRGRDADAVLAEVDPADLTEDELLAWALPTAANQFWMLSEPERATAFLQTTRGKASSPAARTTLDALSATFAMNAGNLGKAVELAGQVLASPDADETAVGWAGSAAALCAARMGKFAEVDAVAERAMSAGQPGLLRFTSGFGQTTALLMAREPERALALARRLTDFAQRRQPGRAIGEVLVADVLIATGETAQAVALLRQSAATLAPTGYSWGPLAWMLLAQALGRLGDTVEAGKALSRAESRHGLKSMLFAPELALARAWTMSARRDTHGAVAAARDAVKAAERGGQKAVALRAAADAVALGDPRGVDTLTRLAREVPCAFGRDAVASSA
ncbi:AAA family ATPase [Mycobacterium sp. PSTR-4-N]|uniref:AAA family ATPase n=1 Tax=Mycobacterium sp. PSTR-4-N TaxID=2917745 RepID=UPI001F152992|nr:AAA family ATPase [Mycobacterium sp. PSTR-4-N]MCG7596994.1 AAA family ATPase [Mycobacterium sp. PSTR-4-N]